MTFKISWAADTSRSGTVWFRSGMVPSCHINYQKFGESMFGKIITKNWFSRQTSHRSNSVTQEVAKLLTHDFTTKDHPSLKPHSP